MLIQTPCIVILFSVKTYHIWFFAKKRTKYSIGYDFECHLFYMKGAYLTKNHNIQIKKKSILIFYIDGFLGPFFIRKIVCNYFKFQNRIFS